MKSTTTKADVRIDPRRIAVALEAAHEVRCLAVMLKDVAAGEDDSEVVEAVCRGNLRRIVALADVVFGALMLRGAAEPVHVLEAVVACADVVFDG